MHKPALLIYIHGFNSSPKSAKAMIMSEYCARQRPDIKVVVPELAAFPEQAALQLHALLQQYHNEYRIGLVGSSLGGFYATWLSEQFAVRAVLVNPAVRPFELLCDYLGEQVNPYTHQHYVLESKHIDELKALDVESVTNPQRLWLLVQEQDEVLDYRQAVSKFAGVKQTIEAGGDHSFVDFERYAGPIIDFLKL